MSHYGIWAALVALLSGLCTVGVIATWDRCIRREAEEARRLAERRDAILAAQRERERRAVAALAASERRHRALAVAGAIVVWRAGPDGRMRAAEGWTALTGQPVEAVLGQPDGWLEPVLPEDRARAWTTWSEALSAGAMLDSEFRLRTAAGEVRWCRVRGVALPPEAEGEAAEWVGVVEDVDERRRLEESRLLLSREINHRARNLLAVVQAVVRMTPVGEEGGAVARVGARIAALGRAHDLLAERDWRGADMAEVARGELAAWLVPAVAANGSAAVAGPRVRIEGPALPLAATAVQPLAMALHELATNAAKHGALSGPDGVVRLCWRSRDGLLRLRWVETGGPSPEVDAMRRGFGTRVVDASVVDQLGGTVERRWEPAGLDCRLAIPLGRVLRVEEGDAPGRMAG